MKTARMTHLRDGSIRLQFPFDRFVVETIKAEIPSHSRTYDPAAKVWYVSGAYVRIVRQLLEDVFLEVEVEDQQHTSYTPPTGSTPATEYHVLHLQPTAPRELVEAAYKCLSRLYHPDRGGDTERMQAINAAISTIRERQAS